MLTVFQEPYGVVCPVEGDIPNRLADALWFSPWVLAYVLARQFAFREASLTFVEEVLRPVFRVWGSRLSKFLAGDKDDTR